MQHSHSYIHTRHSYMQLAVLGLLFVGWDSYSLENLSNSLCGTITFSGIALLDFYFNISSEIHVFILQKFLHACNTAIHTYILQIFLHACNNAIHTYMLQTFLHACNIAIHTHILDILTSMQHRQSYIHTTDILTCKQHRQSYMHTSINNQRTNCPLNAHLISGLHIST